MSGDETTSDESKKPTDGQNPVKTVPQSVFSDDFDDPEDRRSQDELPEDEPLTPELVEEEAIRGDFMLRWATVFLAVLMAFGQINDTKPLVLIRSGDLMRANGFLPPRVDQFSHTVLEKSDDGTMVAGKVSNVSWLFDHIVSLSWLAAGEKGLTLLKVIVASVSAWLLVRISLPGVSTWWSSICAVFAVVACSSDYVPVPELMTILGMTMTMRLLFQHRQGQASGLQWKLPLLIAVWCNLDSRAWVGAFVVVLYALGNGLTRRGLIRGGSSSARIPGPLAGTAMATVLALAVNPFPTSSLLSPITTYSIEYPAMQAQRGLTSITAAVTFDNRVDSFSILHPDAMALFDHTQVAGIAMLLIAVLIVLLSMGSEQRESSKYPESATGRPRGLLRILYGISVLFSGRPTREAGFLFALFGMTVLVVLAAHELPAAAVVAAVVAGVSAQDWYRRSFSMKYTTESKELLFSRGGRAATVLGLAAIGFCVVASRLPGAMPLGFGFDKETRITIDTFSEQIKSLSPDARIVHTRIEQGDMLIWNDRKSFVDSRIVPFGRPGDPDSIGGPDDPKSVFSKHINMLKMLMLPPAEPPKTQDPKEKDKFENTRRVNTEAANETVVEFKITHAITRLAPPGRPDYTSMVSLASPGGWFIVSLGPSAAILERITPAMTTEYVRSKSPQFAKMAFQTAGIAPPGVRQFASPPTFYEKHVYGSRPSTNLNKRLAGHYMFLTGGQPESFEQILSGLSNATLAIRHVNLSLAESPDDAEAFEMLGRCYMRLDVMEQMLGGQQSGGRLKQLRHFQTVMAFRQGLAINPESLNCWDGLLSAYQQLNRIDLASEALENWLLLAEANPPARGDDYQAFLTERFAQQHEYRDRIREMETRFAETIEQQQKQQQQQQMEGTGSEEAKTSDDARDAREVVMQAAMANSGGLPRKALQILQEKSALVKFDPFGSLLFGQMLLEAGDLEEAHRSLAALKSAAQAQPQVFAESEWQLPVATSELAICDYGSAASTWTAQLADLKKLVFAPELYAGALFSLPLVADVNMAINDKLPIWPFQHGLTAGDAVRSATEVRAEIVLLMAMARVEEGDLKNAKTLLQSILSECGDTGCRPLATVYYSLMDDDAEKFVETNTFGNWEEYLFPGEVLPTPDTSGGNGQPVSPTESGSLRP